MHIGIEGKECVHIALTQSVRFFYRISVSQPVFLSSLDVILRNYSMISVFKIIICSGGNRGLGRHEHYFNVIIDNRLYVVISSVFIMESMV